MYRFASTFGPYTITKINDIKDRLNECSWCEGRICWLNTITLMTKTTITDKSILFLSYKGSGNWLTFANSGKIERLDVETSVTENIANDLNSATALDIHYNKELVYWTGDKKIMRYDIHYNKGLMYLTDVVDNKNMGYDIHYNKGLLYLTDVIDENIMRYDINYNKGTVYLTNTGDKKIMRYDIHYNKGLVYLTDVLDNTIMRYDIH